MLNVADAIALLKSHPALTEVGKPQDVGDGTFEVQVGVQVPLPSRQQQAGISATGVKALEPAWLIFQHWPDSAPSIRLREDFPLDLPHINPHRRGERVKPCLFDGDPSELLHRFGLGRIVDQLVEWLVKAASGQLIDITQGWEPTRRDECPGHLVFEAEAAQAKTPKDGALLLTEGLYCSDRKSHMAILSDFKAAQVSFTYEPVPSDNSLVRGVAQVILARGVDEGREPKTVDEYQPETVRDMGTLLDRAARLGIDSEALKRELESYSFRSVVARGHADGWDQGIFAFVVLLVKRPAKIIWANGRTVEMLPYIVRMKPDAKAFSCGEVVAEPLWHVEQVSPDLLAMTSGFSAELPRRKLVFVGCGSLGSKLSMHLGRAGFGRSAAFVDNEVMSPHNAARHALIPDRIPTHYPKKAEMMRAAFQELGYIDAAAHTENAVQLFGDRPTFKDVVGEEPALIVDSTASFKVDAAIASCGSLVEQPHVRLAQTSMYAKGRAAVLYLEGSGRSCTVQDLKAALFERCRHDADLRAAIGGDSTDPVRIFVGDNCRSVTMPMSDSVVSRGASLVGHQIEKWLAEGLPDAGAVCFGKADRAGIAMDWGSLMLGATTVVSGLDDGGWTLRILAPVVELIERESRAAGQLEAGGMLIGHIPPQSRTIIIAGVVEAPTDSIRTTQSFILGVEGRRAALVRAHEESLGHLHFVGTWHSHPMGGAHSLTDKESLKLVAELNGGIPVVSLVWTSTGLIGAVGIQHSGSH